MFSYFECPKIDKQIVDFKLLNLPAVVQWFELQLQTGVYLCGRLLYCDGQYYVQAFDIASYVEEESKDIVDFMNRFYAAKELVMDMQDDGKYMAILESATIPAKHQIIDALHNQVNELLSGYDSVAESEGEDDPGRD